MKVWAVKRWSGYDRALRFTHAAPVGYRKILLALRYFNEQRNQTLGQYYIRTNPHLIPEDVEVWELDEAKDIAERIR